jgi:hypothetical protein
VDDRLYFHGLLRLRICTLNLTLPQREIAPVILSPGPPEPSAFTQPPALADFASTFDFKEAAAYPAFTTFLSPSFIPFFVSAGVLDQVHNVQKCVIGRREAIGDVVQQAAAIWTQSLDQHMWLASVLPWRIAVWQMLLEREEMAPDLAGKMQACLAGNRSALSAALARADAVSAAIGQARAELPVGAPFRVRMRLTKRDLPRLVTAQLPLALAPLRVALAIALHDFRAVEYPTTKQWLAMLAVAFHDRAFHVDADAVVSLLLREMNASNSKERSALEAIVLQMIARNPALARHFGGAQTSVEHRCF